MTGGVAIWYEVRGGEGGTPLMVVNGGPGFDHSYLHCGDCWERLARGRNVVFYDQRGNGRSGELKEGQSCTLADQIADLEAIHRAIPGSELAIFEKSGHLPFCEESDGFVSRLEAFLTKR